MTEFWIGTLYDDGAVSRIRDACMHGIAMVKRFSHDVSKHIDSSSSDF
jgi:hypothetical protein